MFSASYDKPSNSARSTSKMTQILNMKSINSKPEFPIVL